MILYRSTILSGLLAAASATTFAAEPTYFQNGSLSLSSLTALQTECAKSGLDVPAPTSAIQLYKILYKTPDTKGHSVTVSGLLILPKSAPKGAVLYYHGTIIDRNLAPSRYNGTNGFSEPEFVMMAFASGGYAVFMPDTLGLGDSPGIHPYPYSEDNCQSGIDMVAPGRALAKRLGVGIGPHLFIAGYSEGGAEAMCAVRMVEKTHAFPIDMAAPMSGPYDLSGATANSFLKGKLSPEEFGTKLLLLSYAADSSLRNLDNIDLKDYFAPSFASYIPYVFGLNLDEIGMAKRFVNKAVQLGDVDSLDRILTRKFRDAITSSDLTNPILAEMKRSDCYNWTPRTKMLLPYLVGDTVVTDANTTEAMEAMRHNGVGADRLRAFPISEKKLSHYTAASIAYTAARRFFDGGFSGVWPN